MPTVARLTALALARAMLAGRPGTAGLLARMRACLGAGPPWCVPLARRCARLPGEHWRRLTPRTLARWIEDDAGYRQAWRADHRPSVRRYILRERAGMNPLPVGLDHCRLPCWPHTAALGR